MFFLFPSFGYLPWASGLVCGGLQQWRPRVSSGSAVLGRGGARFWADLLLRFPRSRGASLFFVR